MPRNTLYFCVYSDWWLKGGYHAVGNFPAGAMAELAVTAQSRPPVQSPVREAAAELAKLASTGGHLDFKLWKVFVTHS